MLNLNKQTHNYDRTKKHVISTFCTQMQMALIQGVPQKKKKKEFPQDPTGEREEGRVCFHSYFSLDRLRNDVFWARVCPEQSFHCRRGRGWM